MVSMMGMVDDLIGITEAGFNAKQMNVFINVKTAEKTLQFGPNKCKTMFVGKSSKLVLDSDLHVDEPDKQLYEFLSSAYVVSPGPTSRKFFVFFILYPIF